MRALIVVDVQRDFCEGGALPVTGGAEVARAIADLLVEHDYDHVVATLDYHVDPGDHFSDDPDYQTSWPRHCVVGTSGVEFHPAFASGPVAAVFRKGQYSAAYSGFEAADADGVALAEWLRARGVDTVDVVGIATDFCVRSTALDAVAEGLATRVLLDLTAGVSPATTSTALDALRAAGVTIA